MASPALNSAASLGCTMPGTTRGIEVRVSGIACPEPSAPSSGLDAHAASTSPHPPISPLAVVNPRRGMDMLPFVNWRRRLLHVRRKAQLGRRRAQVGRARHAVEDVHAVGFNGGLRVLEPNVERQLRQRQRERCL